MTESTLPPIPDLEARVRAQSDFDGPLVVEAGAGTGKTALLVARIAAWCVGPGWQRHEAVGVSVDVVARNVVDRVVAITFTDAAAAEMAERLAGLLAALAAGEPPESWQPDSAVVPDVGPELTRRATAILDELHRLRVHTIHAWCQRLLRAYPLESGLHPRFEIDADGSLGDEVVQGVVDDRLRDPTCDLDDDWLHLATVGFGPAGIADAAVALVKAGVRKADLEPDPFDPARATVWWDTLRAAVIDFRAVERGRMEAAKRASRAVSTSRAVGELAAAVAELQSGEGFHGLIQVAAALDPKDLERLGTWSGGVFGKAEAEAIGDDAADLAVAAGRLFNVVGDLQAMRPEAFDAARRVLSPILGEARARMRARGIVTYDDLLVCARDLLESSASVLAEVCAGIDQLLVDEFQDTDRTQCRIVEMVGLEGPPDDATRPILFLVGDPKQSIYGWRRADLAAYDALVEPLEQAGRVVRLVANFRSAEPILREVERLVAPVMERETGVQPDFQPLEPTADRIGSPGYDEPPWSAVEHWVAWPVDGETGLPASSKRGHQAETALEAEAVAADIRRLHDGGVAWSEFAILLRATSELEMVLEALRQRGVPYDVSRERDYYRQREVVEATAMVRAVLEPSDMLALLALLRSDMVGLPDRAVAPLWDAGFAARMAEVSEPRGDPFVRAMACVDIAAAAVGPKMSKAVGLPDWEVAARAAVENLARLREIARDASPDELVARMRDLWMAEVGASARYLGRVRRARLDRFYLELEEALVRHGGAPAAVARFLRRAVEEGRESLLPPEPDGDTDAVHVMTIHGAKGLDFGHVYLIQTHKGRGRSPREALAEWLTGDRGPEYALFGWPTPGMPEARRARARREAAEQVRLLYVALTRAKRRLVVTGAWKKPGIEVAPAAATCLADLVAARGDADALEDQAAAGIARRSDDNPHVQWVIPILEQLPDLTDPMERLVSAPATAELETMRRDADALSGLRTAAAVRMQRPYSGRASDESHRMLDLAEAEGVPAADESGATAIEGAARAAGMAIGTAVHSLLEELDLSCDLESQLAARRDELVTHTVAGLDREAADTARQRLDALLDRLEESTCLARLAEIGPFVLARELPILAPPPADGGAVAFVAGAIDLVYRDPATGRVVVADYKTDRVVDDEGIATRSAVYRPQLETYGRLLEEAFSLADSPEIELWFLEADRIVRLVPSRH
jgi:ATP-dependent helicase/nuclease subunit A